MDNKKDALLSLEAKWQEGIRDWEGNLEKNMSKILTRDIDVTLVEDVLSKYIVFENGKYIYQNEYNAAIISWRPDQFSI
ncbi:hypothetical protein FS935_17335 [Metabacillus litoralis]|uniref:Uncharacterized protein n=1 Tax=Metabacillus litoralis TaxID=152268 RepID=A0A5C6VUP7_9BACI|nr:hypothetical protein [Metabacillus litoralis]TXC89242.1 hypothetical protein FS935_17335 [Metabacillus litoralis]